MANNADATLTISEGNNVPRDPPNRQGSLAITLVEGEHKVIRILVTAQDTTVQAAYTVTVSRASAMDRATLGFVLAMRDITVEIDPDDDSGTVYIGKATGRIENTTASASVTATGVSIQSIRLGEDENSENYVIRSPVELMANANPVTISRSIPLAGGSAQIVIVVRRADDTEDDYTEANYIVNIEASALRIRVRVFLEGPLQ